MPHKHKRKGDANDSLFNLAPSDRAAPLPVGKTRAPNSAPKKKKRKIADGYGEDDTPKAFARLMQFKASSKGPKGLDNGPQPKQKKPKVNEVLPEDTVDSEAQAIPKIMPGEKLSEFSQRVNQALPLASVQKKGKKVEGMRDHRMTRHEKKLRKLQEGWRAEEARIRDKEQEELELAAEEQDELDAMWEDKTADLPIPSKKKKKKKGKRKLIVGEVDDREEDPWEALKKQRQERKGLHDVVQAPPQFERIPREIFKVKNGARVNVDNIPNSVGSLKKREELGEARQGIINTYRKLMEARRNN
ncbi:uncharacterized protein BDR25DRAFT_336633 [Lindgomyces ingoldianus]|uniref:Uncharacterized protein n=1 Tax=Lindgomyces ingoldianus TaxID=673940 RepID=A0ACB6QIX1_9PLEO|nr:uncharacterized protein BDR25DRAFT_336633 [Lindgomyces ingoldianus]KAF2466072.1 hypothetical protein BDR25DRAFT_336633 [Lindgomyces ingoldianus]